jgi:8-oxo-dGTP pyrophosphatase MutT (NUDIX family)
MGISSDKYSGAHERTVFSTRWFDLIEKAVEGWRYPYYMIRAADVVTVLAMNTAGSVILIRQFRPEVNEHSLQLPSGHMERSDLTLEAAARRELLEETGYSAQRFELLGTLYPDVGRLQVRMWCFFAEDAVKVADPDAEEERTEVLECAPEDLLKYAREAKLKHAQDLAVVLLAMAHGHLRQG